MRVSREISLGSSLHRASTDALIILTFYILLCVWCLKFFPAITKVSVASGVMHNVMQ